MPEPVVVAQYREELRFHVVHRHDRSKQRRRTVFERVGLHVGLPLRLGPRRASTPIGRQSQRGGVQQTNDRRVAAPSCFRDQRRRRILALLPLHGENEPRVDSATLEDVEAGADEGETRPMKPEPVPAAVAFMIMYMYAARVSEYQL